MTQKENVHLAVNTDTKFMIIHAPQSQPSNATANAKGELMSPKKNFAYGTHCGAMKHRDRTPSHTCGEMGFGLLFAKDRALSDGDLASQRKAHHRDGKYAARRPAVRLGGLKRMVS